MGMEATEVANELDRVYRMGNVHIRQNNLPSEVHIKFVRKSFRDEILCQAREKNIQINQKDVKILKDIPWRIHTKRKEYGSLINCLRRNSIEYRWLIPEGVTFIYRGIRR